MEKRIDELEQKFSYQEQLLEQLNEVIVGQQVEIDKLNAELKTFKQSLQGSGIKDVKDETPPPHY